MVKGFDKFKQYFAPHSDSFIVIGGTAMQLHGREGGPVPRVTQDIDILVIVEQMSEPFTSAFHAFLREGRYDCYIAKEPDGSNKPRFYRFINPKNAAFPTRIELLSSPALPPPEGMLYMSLPDEPDDSMSAIVLDRTYYDFAGGGESGRDFVSLPLKTTVAADPRKAKNPKLLGVFWGLYYTVIRRDSLSTV